MGVNSASGLLIEWAIVYLLQPTYLLELEFYKVSWLTMDKLDFTVDVPRVSFVKFVSCDDDLLIDLVSNSWTLIG